MLGIPPILANAYVGVRQVDRGAVDAARGMGMSELEIIRKVELPLAIPTVMGGIRGATIVIVATATIAPLAGVETLGDLIINATSTAKTACSLAQSWSPSSPSRWRVCSPSCSVALLPTG